MTTDRITSGGLSNQRNGSGVCGGGASPLPYTGLVIRRYIPTRQSHPNDGGAWMRRTRAIARSLGRNGEDLFQEQTIALLLQV